MKCRTLCIQWWKVTEYICHSTVVYLYYLFVNQLNSKTICAAVLYWFGHYYILKMLCIQWHEAKYRYLCATAAAAAVAAEWQVQDVSHIVCPVTFGDMERFTAAFVGLSSLVWDKCYFWSRAHFKNNPMCVCVRMHWQFPLIIDFILKWRFCVVTGILCC